MKHYLTPPESGRSRRRRRVMLGDYGQQRPYAPRPLNLAETFRRQVAIGGGALAGGLIGNIPGAFVGAYLADRATRNSVSQKKIMPYKGNPDNKLVNKSAMSVNGKRKLAKPKNVKVSKKFAAMVKKVEAGTEAKGSYTTIKGGFIGSVVNSSTTNTNAQYLQNIMGISSACIIGPSHLDPAGYRTWWNALSRANTPDVVAGDDFNFFTIRKVWDAASVIFNGRVAAQNPYANVTDMLTTVAFSAGTGLGNSTAGNLKVNVLNSWVQFKMKNVSDRVVNVDIFELTPKLKFQDLAPLSAMRDIMENDTFVEDAKLLLDTEFRYFASNTGNAQQKMFLDNNIDAPSIANRYGFNFKIVKKTMVLAPDETCVHSIQGPKGLIDFAKMTVDGVQKEKLLKNFSVSCLMSVYGDQVLPATAGIRGARLARLTNVPAVPFQGNFSMPVAIEMEESYSVGVPEVAGFINNALANGTGQPLTFRKKKVVFANFLEANGDTSITGTAAAPVYGANAYIVSNEVNPLAAAGAPGFPPQI